MRRSAAGILALALAACAVGPDYQRPEAAVSAAYKEAVGWKVAEPRDEASRGNWWEIFGDPKLSALIESIDMSNQNVLLAEARFRPARSAAPPPWRSIPHGKSICGGACAVRLNRARRTPRRARRISRRRASRR